MQNDGPKNIALTDYTKHLSKILILFNNRRNQLNYLFSGQKHEKHQPSWQV